MRSLPDPFVKNLRGVVTNSLLPASMPPVNAGDGQLKVWGLRAHRLWHQTNSGSNPASTPHQLTVLPQPTCDQFSTLYDWTYRLVSPPTHYALEKKCNLMFKSFQNWNSCLSYFILNNQVEVWEKEASRSPKYSHSLHWVPLAVHLRVKNEVKRKAIKNMGGKKSKLPSTMTIISHTTDILTP